MSEATTDQLRTLFRTVRGVFKVPAVAQAIASATDDDPREAG